VVSSASTTATRPPGAQALTAVTGAARASGALRISARADYALRAAIELAVAHDQQRATKRDAIGRLQDIPVKFLETVLGDLRHHGIVCSQRGVEGGYWLARPPAEITVADVIRAVSGSLASVRAHRPEDLHYSGSAEPLQGVWIAVRAAIREVVETVTLADLASNELPAHVRKLAADPGAWKARDAG
jgi:Rrf2 family protein